MTLFDIHRLAATWCPVPARYERFIAAATSWAPAHEIGHALIEPVERHKVPGYGRCTHIPSCRCPFEECVVYEAAAIRVSRELVAAAGKPQLIAAEIRATEHYHLLNDRRIWRRARELLRRSGVWPIPVTVADLEAALARNGLAG